VSTEKGSTQKQPELMTLNTCSALSCKNPIEDDEFWTLLSSLDPVEVLEENAEFDPRKTDFGNRQRPREVVTVSRLKVSKSA